LDSIRGLEGILWPLSVKWSARLLAQAPNPGKILKERANGGTNSMEMQQIR